MIKATNIHKSYGALEVLKGVDLHISKGEIISIVGASGAGKTTLLQILGTLDVPSNSEKDSLVINGTEILGLREKDLARFRNEHIGFIFQFHQLLPEFTAQENVCLPAFIKGTPKADAEARARELLAFLGLSERMRHKPAALSGGEQQRVAVARSLINNPSIILPMNPVGTWIPKVPTTCINFFLTFGTNLDRPLSL